MVHSNAVETKLKKNTKNISHGNITRLTRGNPPATNHKTIYSKNDLNNLSDILSSR